VSDSILPVVVAFCSQKGGVGKSTLARALAAAAAKDTGVRVRIIDVDELQETAHAWAERRAKLGLTPTITVTVAERIDNLRGLAGDADVLIVDAPGRASRETLTIARQAHLVVQPTAGSSDDLLPGIALYKELVEERVDPKRLVWALSRVDSEVEERDLRQFLEGQGWRVLKGCLFNRSAYKRAMDAGYSVTETAFPSLNKKAAALIDSLHETLRQTVATIHDELRERKAGSAEMAA
jgi:chromosome partitioning protein